MYSVKCVLPEMKDWKIWVLKPHVQIYFARKNRFYKEILYVYCIAFYLICSVTPFHHGNGFLQ